MLELKEYNYSELVQIFKTDRLDKIKEHIKNDGYNKIIQGCGKQISITITELPTGRNLFRVYCRDILNFKHNINYDKLYSFMKRLLLDEEFKNLQFEQMSAELSKEGIRITPTTISSYFHHLISLGMYQFIPNEYVYEAKRLEDGETIRISREQYNDFYKNYYITKRQLGESMATRYQKSMYQSMPRKRLMPLKNYMYKKHYDFLIPIFLEEGETNG